MEDLPPHRASRAIPGSGIAEGKGYNTIGRNSDQTNGLPSDLHAKREDADSTHGGMDTATELITKIETEPDLLSPQSRIHPAYKPLGDDCIRLLKIQQGRDGSPIYCYLQEFSLSAAPEYVALSYTWGSQYGIHEIFINACWFLVPTNLWRFLTQARRSGGVLSGWLWVDMLSINQRSIGERSHQVILMSRIFHTAKSVLVWLGPAYQRSDAAMEGMLRYSKKDQTRTQSLRAWAGDVGHAMNGICARAYWRRLWIFQELRLSREAQLMCGDKRVAWHQFEAIMYLTEIKSGTFRVDDNVEISARSSAMQMVRLNMRTSETALWELIQTTTHLRCVDVRDKVYALLGVATDEYIAIEPDYSVPIPTFLNQIYGHICAISPPRSLGHAAALCRRVENLMGLERGTIFTMKGQ